MPYTFWGWIRSAHRWVITHPRISEYIWNGLFAFEESWFKAWSWLMFSLFPTDLSSPLIFPMLASIRPYQTPHNRCGRLLIVEYCSLESSWCQFWLTLLCCTDISQITISCFYSNLSNYFKIVIKMISPPAQKKH